MTTATHAVPTTSYAPPAEPTVSAHAAHMATGLPFPPPLRASLPTAPRFATAQEGIEWILGGP